MKILIIINDNYFGLKNFLLCNFYINPFKLILLIFFKMIHLGKIEKLADLTREDGFHFIKRAKQHGFIDSSSSNEQNYLYNNSDNLLVCYVYLGPLWRKKSSVLLTNLDNLGFERAHDKLRKIYQELNNS